MKAAAALSTLCRPGTWSCSTCCRSECPSLEVQRAGAGAAVGFGAGDPHVGIRTVAVGAYRRADVPRQQVPDPGIIGTGNQQTVLGQQLHKPVKGGKDSFSGAVVVQVVGLNVGDDGDLGASSSGMNRRIRRLRQQTPVPYRRPAFTPRAATSPPIAKEGSRPASRSRTVIMAVVVVLPCVPATATTSRTCHGGGQRLANGG